MLSTFKLYNVILAHSGVSPLVVCLSRNNKSTRYAAFFQLTQTPLLSITSASFLSRVPLLQATT
jgi:hypothetical protein